MPRKKDIEQVRNRKPKVSLPAREGGPRTFDASPGLLAAIQRLRGAEIQAAQDYQLSLTTNDTDLIARKKKDWIDLLEQLRKVEISTPDVQKANSQTLPVAEVEQEVSRMCNAFRVSLEALPRSLAQRLAGADQVTIQEVLTKSINEALAQLHNDRWKIK